MNLDFVLLTVRGTFSAKSLEDARVLHNETAGSPQGIAAARALSDLSHTVFHGIDDKKELLFIDYWQDPAGLQQFFSDHRVQEQGGKLFSERDGTVWMPAVGAFGFQVPATLAAPKRFAGLIRAGVKSPDKTIEAFRAAIPKRLRDARRRGQLSHHLFFKLGEGQPEVLGLDIWSSQEGMLEHYSDRSAYGPLMETFTGAPITSIWEQPSGFSEW